MFYKVAPRSRETNEVLVNLSPLISDVESEIGTDVHCGDLYTFWQAGRRTVRVHETM